MHIVNLHHGPCTAHDVCVYSIEEGRQLLDESIHVACTGTLAVLTPHFALVCWLLKQDPIHGVTQDCRCLTLRDDTPPTTE